MIRTFLRSLFGISPVRSLMNEKETEIFGLSMEEAEARAERLLSDTARFRTVPASDSGNDRLDLLAPRLRDFFTRWQFVETTIGEACLRKESIEESCINPQFIVIGTNSEHTEVVVRPGSEQLVEIDGSEPPEELLSDQYPSVYHWLLIQDWVLYGDD